MIKYDEAFKYNAKDEVLEMLKLIGEHEWYEITDGIRREEKTMFAKYIARIGKLTSYDHYIIWVRLKEVTGYKGLGD